MIEVYSAVSDLLDRPLHLFVTAVTAGIFLESFYRQLATGRILRDSVVALMYVQCKSASLPCPSPRFTRPPPPKPLHRRTWRLWNLAAGTDLSWGAFDAMATALNITPMEVEGPEEVVYDVPHAERCVVRSCGCRALVTNGWGGL